MTALIILACSVVAYIAHRAIVRPLLTVAGIL